MCGNTGCEPGHRADRAGANGRSVDRVRRGRMAYHRGLAAEDQVVAAFERRGARVLARRWRGGSGEIDLIVDEPGCVVFVEIKSARTHQLAAERVGARQLRRIAGSAVEFLDTQPKGQLTPARFDVALVDQQGRIDVLENVLAA